MKRTQVQLDEKSYELLRRRAHERRVSVAAVVREAVGQYLAEAPRRKRTLADFGFIGIGRSDQSDYAPVSERHDEALADAMYAEMQGKADQFSRRHGLNHS